MGEQITYSISEATEEATQGISISYFEKEAFDIVLNSNCTSEEKTRLFAELARFNTLYMVAKAGSGHLGSSFSSLDIISWLYLNVLKPEDRFFSSKGHDSPGLYAVQTALGILPFEKIHALRRLGGLPGHPDVGIPGAVTNTGSLGMGISKAKGFLYADDLLKVKKGRLFVLTGDGELQEGQLWESLVSAIRRKDNRLFVIVDHNKVQSDTFVANVSDLGDLVSKFSSFGWDASEGDGHNLGVIRDFIDEPGKSKPKILVANTIKGKGVSFMEHTSMGADVEYYKYHSGAPGKEDYSLARKELLESINLLGNEMQIVLPNPIEVSADPIRISTESEKMIPAYAEAILGLARSNSRIVALDADLVLDTGLIPFKNEFPNRFIECGIAEQDMVSQAGTMALGGLVPIVHSFACFLTSRASEQIYNNCSQGSKVIYVGSLAGLLPAGPGSSHQSVRDISAMSCMYDMKLIEPMNANQLAVALDWAVNKNQGSTYLRLTSVPYIPVSAGEADMDFTEGRGIVMNEGSQLTIITSGPIMSKQVMIVAAKFKDEMGINVKVIVTPWLNSLDADWYRLMLQDSSKIAIVENHYTENGFGSYIISHLSQAGVLAGRATRMIGLNEKPKCGQQDEILKYHKLDTESIFNSLVQFLDAN
ncbi:transketolase [Daejeonella rubra]|uniref:Transketolase n=1 Tax=Daejeonella rubra TaxID=990371 RepID=A0A1G9WV86_9SPHI|nr:transketolase C-terminal domain-containing protein [Daejeonella rubra]SDM88387.1 transketolase [Daejeonella rubra]